MGRAVGSQPSPGDNRHAVGEFARLVGVVGREDDGVAALAQGAHPLQHDKAIAEIEARRRLVHDQQRRILRKGARDQAELPLAAGDPVGVGGGKRLDAEIGERCVRARAVGGARPANGPRWAVRPIRTRSRTV